MDFRTGRADPILRKGEIYGVVWSPDFVSEPVVTDRIYVERHSVDLFDFERSRWEFTGNEIDLHLKEGGGKVTVGEVFVGIQDHDGVAEFKLGNVVATADGLDTSLIVRQITGSFDTGSKPPRFVKLDMEGIRLPDPSEGEGSGYFQGIPLGELQGELKKLGYEDAEFDIALSATYDRKTKGFEIDTLSIDAPGLARMTFGLSLKDVSRELRIRGLGDIGGAAAIVKIVGARIELEDLGLVRRAMEQRAGDRRLELEEAALEIANRWPIGPTEKAALVAFLVEPNSVLIELDPPSPAKVLNLIALRKTEAILRRLGLRVTNYSGG